MLINFKDACKEIGVKASTLYQWTEMGFVPVIRIGKLLKYDRERLLKHFESGEFARIKDEKKKKVR